MRLNNRNMQPFWYALYDSTVADYEVTGYDDYGNPLYGNQTGTYAKYGNPVKAYGVISPARGVAETRQFGDELNYDRVISVEDRDTPINEYAVLWIDREPEVNLWGELRVNANGDYVTPWDYIVRRVGRGLPTFGSAVIAISRVDVS